MASIKDEGPAVALTSSQAIVVLGVLVTFFVLIKAQRAH